MKTSSSSNSREIRRILASQTPLFDSARTCAYAGKPSLSHILNISLFWLIFPVYQFVILAQPEGGYPSGKVRFQTPSCPKEQKPMVDQKSFTTHLNRLQRTLGRSMRIDFRCSACLFWGLGTSHGPAMTLLYNRSGNTCKIMTSNTAGWNEPILATLIYPTFLTKFSRVT